MSKRFDTRGMFWDDAPPEYQPKAKEAKGPREPRVQPSYRSLPDYDKTWQPPREFPNLSCAKWVSIDTENYDPFLEETGPSTKRGGFMVGVSVATEDRAWYFPMRHSVEGEKNLVVENVVAWARDTFAVRRNYVFHSAAYDLEWLGTDEIQVLGDIHDISYAEPLLDENQLHYSLEAIAQRHLGEGKVDEALYAWLARAYGGKPTRRAQGRNIYRAPPSLVGPYAEADAALPLRVLKAQRPLLEEQELWDLYRLECRLIPILLHMRKHGVRVDVNRAQRIYDEWTAAIKKQEQELTFNINAPREIAAWCDKNGIDYPRTGKGNPSFVAEWLQHHPDPRIRAISDLRKWVKARDTFIKGYILDKNVNGRIYALFNPNKSDDSGTISGRFSSSLPNLQNIPARDEVIGPAIRSCFVPEQNCLWWCFDWSQIEFRLLTHFGRGEGVQLARKMYREDPKTDFHDMVSALTGLKRKQAKNINFGLVYGMGDEKLANDMGIPLDEAMVIQEEYHTRLPFVKYTYDEAAKLAKNRGWIKTILGRRAHFDLWEPAGYRPGVFAAPALRREEALAEYGTRIRRAFTHKTLNRLLQGSAADMMKKAMVDIYEAGLLDRGILHLTVHDELDWSIPYGDTETPKLIQQLMVDTLPLLVPVLVDAEKGPSWGEVA